MIRYKKNYHRWVGSLSWYKVK